MRLQDKIVEKLKNVYYTYSPAVQIGKGSRKVTCPCCGWSGPEFLPNGTLEVRKNARCPKCDSKERHRLYYLYLRDILPTDKKYKVLHFAPEKIITQLFQSYKNIEYLSADIDPSRAMVKQDITQITLPDNSFDFIFCSHVLEHIADDIKAMTELKRILKPGGTAAIMVPIKDNYRGRVIDKTYEDFTITDPKERDKIFGQFDHVRIYGRDYKDRLEKAGFNVTVIKFAQSLPQGKIEQYGLLPLDTYGNETDGWIYICTK